MKFSDYVIKMDKAFRKLPATRVSNAEEKWFSEAKKYFMYITNPFNHSTRLPDINIVTENITEIQKFLNFQKLWMALIMHILSKCRIHYDYTEMENMNYFLLKYKASFISFKKNIKMSDISEDYHYNYLLTAYNNTLKKFYLKLNATHKEFCMN